MIPVPPLSKDPEGLPASQCALRYMTKAQLSLQHQGKEMTLGKAISKFLRVNGAIYIYKIAEAQHNNIVTPTASVVRVCVFKPQEKNMSRLRYSSNIEVHRASTEANRSLLSILLCFSLVERSIPARDPLKKKKKKQIKYKKKNHQVSDT